MIFVVWNVDFIERVVVCLLVIDVCLFIYIIGKYCQMDVCLDLNLFMFICCDLFIEVYICILIDRFIYFYKQIFIIYIFLDKDNNVSFDILIGIILLCVYYVISVYVK